MFISRDAGWRFLKVSFEQETVLLACTEFFVLLGTGPHYKSRKIAFCKFIADPSVTIQDFPGCLVSGFFFQ